MFHRTQLMLWFLLVALCSAPALAQDEPLIGDEQPPPTPAPQPPPPPPPPPTAQPQPMVQPQPAPTPTATVPGEMTPRRQKDITDTDHDMVIKSVGLQIVYVANIGAKVATSSPPASSGGGSGHFDEGHKAPTGGDQAQMGVRTWFTRGVGLDAGLSLYIGKPGAPDTDAEDTQFGFGLHANVPFALGVYRHIVMFAGPEVGFALWHPGEETNYWLFNFKGKAGAEISFGFMDIPRLSVIGTMSLGMRVFNNGDDTELLIANDAGFSLGSLFETGVGLVWYI